MSEPTKRRGLVMVAAGTGLYLLLRAGVFDGAMAWRFPLAYAIATALVVLGIFEMFRER